MECETRSRKVFCVVASNEHGGRAKFLSLGVRRETLEKADDWIIDFLCSATWTHKTTPVFRISQRSFWENLSWILPSPKMYAEQRGATTEGQEQLERIWEFIEDEYPF